MNIKGIAGAIATVVVAGLVAGREYATRKKERALQTELRVVRTQNENRGLLIEELDRREQERRSAARYRAEQSAIRAGLEARQAQGHVLTPEEVSTLGYFRADNGRRIYFDE